MLRHSIALIALLSAPACAETDGVEDTGTSGSGDAIPTEVGEIPAWLETEGYASWASESAIHGSTGPHGVVRTYFNDTLVSSFDAQNTTHPVGSASVKELYDASNTLIGAAVMLKLTEGTDADSWYWYLATGENVTADGTGVPTCENCHASGTDRVLTPYPLQ